MGQILIKQTLVAEKISVKTLNSVVFMQCWEFASAIAQFYRPMPRLNAHVKMLSWPKLQELLHRGFSYS